MAEMNTQDQQQAAAPTPDYQTLWSDEQAENTRLRAENSRHLEELAEHQARNKEQSDEIAKLKDELLAAYKANASKSSEAGEPGVDLFDEYCKKFDKK